MSLKSRFFGEKKEWNFQQKDQLETWEFKNRIRERESVLPAIKIQSRKIYGHTRIEIRFLPFEFLVYTWQFFLYTIVLLHIFHMR